ncbi:phage tail protein [Streptomyces phaeoluteigriseus]|uniref:Phage tail protein n=1 Tax=Streptomyces phaeoluteigriseus TaxID=114686 RepID=A0ABY4ZDE3_9ACTN|nr:phage tail protein [Streptomyces phaeoluteigriseus]USQ86981.1 phage tail protein [Streptomyces phaeoluteigriseus]
MGNDIEIRVRVANQTAAGLTSLNASLTQLRTRAQNAGTALTGLTARSTAAAAALRLLDAAAKDAARSLADLRHRVAAADAAIRDLRDGTNNASNSMRTMNTRAQTANTRLGDLSARTRTLRSDTDDLDGSMRSLVTTMGGLGGSLGTIRTSSGGAGNGMQGLRKAALLLSPALIPIAAAAAPIAGSLLAAGTALGVFGLAIGGQIAQMAKASETEKKYKEAVKEHGRASAEAAEAEKTFLSQVRQMDPATRRASAAFSVFKDTYKQWTKDVAGDTMPVVTKSFAVFGGMLPRLAPLVRSTSGELDRLMTVLAGGVNSAGFDRLTSTFAEFASGTLSKATDGLVRFMRSMSGGGGSSQLTEFMAYVREVGPQVGETLGNLGQALAHLVASASDVGVSILSAVNAFAKLVNAIPTETLGNLLQFVLVFKAVQMAAAGLGGAGGAMAAFGTSLAAMSAASTAAGGGLAGLAAAFGTLSRAAKVALIGSGIGILVVALASLSEMGKKAPPDIDKMSTSLGNLAQTGKLSGEAARVFGQDYEKLSGALSTLARPSTMDKIQQGLTSLIGMDSTPVKDAKEAFEGLDKGLTSLVRGGKANLASVALKDAIANLKEEGWTAKEVTSQLDDYKAALADAAFEAKLAAQAQGLFGEQAAAVQAKLDGQKASADGLRNSIEALNEANRSALGGMIGFEASIDAAATAAKDNAGSLDMINGKLDVNSPKAQAAATALNDLAARTKDAALAARESGESWESVNGIYERGRKAFIDSAIAMGLSRAEAQLLAESIMNIPDEKKTRYEMAMEDAKAGLEAFNTAIKATPGAKKVTLQTLSKGAESILEAFGMKVKRLPNGKVTVTTKNGQALSGISDVAGALANLDGDSATTYLYNKTINTIITQSKTYRSVHDIVGKANGGLMPRYADGDQVQVAPNGLLRGPGSGRSDDILAMFASGAMGMVSNTEFVVNAESTRRHLPLLEAINKNQLPGFASGGLTSGQLKGLSAPSDVAGLKGTLGEVRTRIKDKTAGRTESRLLNILDAVGKKLVAHERALTSVNASLSKAKDKLKELTSASAQMATGIKSNILSSASITRGASGDAPTTVRSIMSGLTASRDKASAFSGALSGLRSKGLSPALLQQIAEAGIEGGGLETAGALMSASSSEIGSINNLQSQINASASSAGRTTADHMYATAIKQQTVSVNKLQASQDRLERTMAALAKSLDKTLGRAIGKKSAGGIVGAAASGGIRGGLTWVGEHEPELLQLPVGSRVWSGPDSRRKAQQMAPWASMLNTPRRGTAGGGASVSLGPQELVVRLEIDGRQMSGNRFEDFLVNELRRAVRVRGSINATFQPRR